MKTIVHHINEHNITSLYNSILSKIENINPASVDDETVKIFKRIHSNLQTLDNVAGETGEEIKLIDKLDNYLYEKGLEFCKKDITQILINSGELKKYVSIISDNNKLAEFTDILHGSNENLIDIIHISLKKQIARRTLQKLAKLKPMQKRIAKGDFEVFLKLFTNSAANDDGDYNPIVSGNNYATVEIKNGEGVFAGQNTWQDNTAECAVFNKKYGFSIMPLTSKNKNYLPLIELCKKGDDTYLDEICEEITNIYLNSVKNSNAENLFDDLKNQLKNNIASCLDVYDTEINASLRERFKIQFDELRKILATFSLICYHQMNKFQFLLISKKTDTYSNDFGKYKIYEMPTTIKIKWENYSSIIEDIQYFKGMPMCDNNASHNISLDWTSEN